MGNKRSVFASHVLPPDDQLQILACRAMGHRWEEYNPSLPRPRVSGYRISLRCECQTTRHDIISTVTGELMDRDYWHPDAYFEVGGTDAPTTRRGWKVLYIRARKEMVKLAEKGTDTSAPHRLRVVG